MVRARHHANCSSFPTPRPLYPHLPPAGDVFQSVRVQVGLDAADPRLALSALEQQRVQRAYAEAMDSLLLHPDAGAAATGMGAGAGGTPHSPTPIGLRSPLDATPGADALLGGAAGGNPMGHGRRRLYYRQYLNPEGDVFVRGVPGALVWVTSTRVRSQQRRDQVDQQLALLQDTCEGIVLCHELVSELADQVVAGVLGRDAEGGVEL